VRAVVVLALALVAPPSLVLQASPSFQRVGPYRIDARPTYAGALAKLGPSSSCRLLRHDPSWALAVWSDLGVALELRTYGSLPPHRTGCSAPSAIYVSTAKVSSRRWRTALDLHVGDGLPQLHRLYPGAVRTAGLTGWYGSGYWLVTRRSRCAIGVCTTRLVTSAVLTAEVHSGRISAFVFVIGAEGG
jgi:hypothetical protein